jgi:anti-sigma factor RsiW
MSAGDDCKQVLLTQADFDGELDAAQAAEQAAHRETCAQCRAAYERLAMVRAALREDDLYQRAPDSLRAALQRSDVAPSVANRTARSGWWPAANFGLGAALAAGIALLVGLSDTSDLTDRIVDDHIRALQPGHLWDVESTDRHTVKPWFDGKIDFAPPVKDLADKQFPLKGGRLDYVDGRPVAGLVYEHGHHPIDLLIWPAAGAAAQAPTVAVRNGYNVVHWTEGGMVLWAVSDLERDQLVDFVRLWREAS